jgi:hypothetical protein
MPCSYVSTVSRYSSFRATHNASRAHALGMHGLQRAHCGALRTSLQQLHVSSGHGMVCAIVAMTVSVHAGSRAVFWRLAALPTSTYNVIIHAHTSHAHRMCSRQASRISTLPTTVATGSPHGRGTTRSCPSRSHTHVSRAGLLVKLKHGCPSLRYGASAGRDDKCTSSRSRAVARVMV